MKKEQFYKAYANTPLENRFRIISFLKGGTMTLTSIYKQIKELDDDMRPKIIQQEKLLRLAELMYCNEKQSLSKRKPKWTPPHEK